MSHTKQLSLVLLTAVLLWFAPPLLVFAQDYIPLAPIEAPGTAEKFTGCSGEEISGVWNKNTGTWTTPPSCLPKYLTTVYNMGIALAGLFLVFAIVRGGFTLMFTDSVLGKLEGKKIILQAMGGAVIVFASYLFLNTINPQLAGDLNLSLKFPRVVIKKFESKLKPVDRQELLQLALSKKEMGAVADAQQWTQEAEEWDKEADKLPDSDPNKSVFRERARNLRADAATVLVVKKGDVFGENAKTAAQNANPRPNGAPDVNIEYAREQLSKMDTEYQGDAIRPGIPKIIEHGNLEQGLSLYEKWNTDYNAAERAIAESYINKNYTVAERVIAASDINNNLVNGANLAAGKIEGHAIQLLENLTQYKTDAPSDKKPLVQAAIDNLKRSTCNTLQSLKDSCKDKNLSCRTRTSASELSCTPRE